MRHLWWPVVAVQWLGLKIKTIALRWRESRAKLEASKIKTRSNAKAPYFLRR